MAFRPKTRHCYNRMFKVFVGFCICVNVPLAHISIALLLSFMEYLVVHEVSVHMLSNYVSALKAMFMLHNLPSVDFDHPQIRYFLKAARINRPLAVTQKHVLDISTLKRLIVLVSKLHNGVVYKTMFLVGSFGFFVCPIWFPMQL